MTTGCFCMSPQGNDPYCPCEMAARGLERSPPNERQYSWKPLVETVTEPNGDVSKTIQMTPCGEKLSLDTVRVAIHGCDDSTIFSMDVSADQLEFLKTLSDKTKEVSTYGCMPTLSVYTREDEEWEWYE